MKLLDLTLDCPKENVALDEALLDSAELDPNATEVLRLWEPKSPFVVLGRSSPWSTEVNHQYCNEHSIPIVRRASGGQAIVNGPGCLTYCVLLDYRERPYLRMLDQAHAFVMERMQKAIASLGIATEMNGTSDLTIGNQLKFSGNAMRAKRNWMVYHGTMLCEMDLELIFQCSGPPKRTPDYRGDRSHREFLTTLPTTCDELKQAIIETWLTEMNGVISANDELTEWPRELTAELVAEKYSTQEWTRKVN